jgi:chromosome partitioning protein
MIVTVASRKGGVGKTTLALNLAVGMAKHGREILLIDADEQATALAFTGLRRGLNPPPDVRYATTALQGAAVRQVRYTDAATDVVIDVGGRDSEALRAALTISNLVLIPTAPRSFDLWGVSDTAELVCEAREINEELRAVAIVNNADAGGKDNSEALAALAEIPGVEVCPHTIGRRKAFPNAAAAGLSVFEYTDRSNPDGVAKARAEMYCILHYLQLISCRKEQS